MHPLLLVIPAAGLIWGALAAARRGERKRLHQASRAAWASLASRIDGFELDPHLMALLGQIGGRQVRIDWSSGVTYGYDALLGLHVMAPGSSVGMLQVWPLDLAHALEPRKLGLVFTEGPPLEHLRVSADDPELARKALTPAVRAELAGLEGAGILTEPGRITVLFERIEPETVAAASRVLEALLEQGVDGGDLRTP